MDLMTDYIDITKLKPHDRAAAWVKATDAVLHDLKCLGPNLIVLHLGTDSHRLDDFVVPAGVGGLDVEHYVKLTEKLKAVAAEIGQSKGLSKPVPIIAVTEGGYMLRGVFAGAHARVVLAVVSGDVWFPSGPQWNICLHTYLVASLSSVPFPSSRS